MGNAVFLFRRFLCRCAHGHCLLTGWGTGELSMQWLLSWCGCPLCHWQAGYVRTCGGFVGGGIKAWGELVRSGPSRSRGMVSLYSVPCDVEVVGGQ